MRQYDPVTWGKTASAAEPGTELRTLGFFLLFFNAEIVSKVWIVKGEHCIWI